MLKANKIPILERFSKKPVALEDAFETVTLGFIQQYFEQRGLWASGGGRSDYLISSKTSNALESTHYKVKILVDRGPIRPLQAGGIGNYRGQSPDWKGREYSDKITGPVNVYCIANEEHVASEVASQIFEFLLFLRLQLRTHGFFKIEPPIMGQRAPIKTEGNVRQVGVPITFNVEMELHWAVEEIAPIMQAIEFEGCEE